MISSLHAFARICSVVFVIGFPLTGSAQSPSDAVNQYFKDYQAQGMKSVVSHLHSAELVKIKNELMPFLDIKKTPQAARLREDLFGNSISYLSLERDSPTVFVKKLFSHLANDSITSALKLDSFEILGELKEGADVHVLVRTKFSYTDIELINLDAVTTRLDKTEWRLLPPKEVATLSRTIQSMLKTYSFK